MLRKTVILVLFVFVGVGCHFESKGPPYDVVLSARTYDQTLARALKFNFVWPPELNETNFPSDCQEGEHVSMDVIDLDVPRYGMYDDQAKVYDEALKVHADSGFRPAKMCEFLAFVTQYPNATRKISKNKVFFAIGSAWLEMGYSRMPEPGFSTSPTWVPDQLHYPSMTCFLEVCIISTSSYFGGKTSFLVVESKR